MENIRKLKDFNPYGCPVAHFMNVIGGKWKIMIFYALSINIRRFSNLKRAMPAISKQTLVNMLRELEADGLVRRVVYSESPPRVEYELIGESATMMSMIKLMEDWGMKDLERLKIENNCSFKNILDLIEVSEA